MATGSNMHNLTTLIKRLEAATSRLEDMATTNGDDSKGDISHVSASGPASSESVSPSQPSRAPVAATSEPLPEMVMDFDDFIAEAVKPFVSLSDKFGGAIALQATTLLRGFAAQRKFLYISTKSKKPEMSDPAYMTLLKPIQDEMEAVSEIREKNRGQPDFNNLSAVAEGISVLAWVTVDTRPFKFVDESLGSAQYYGNRVLKEYRDKDPKQVEWVQAYYKIFRGLSGYVKEKLPNGMVWNANGMSPLEAMRAVDEIGTSTASPAPGPRGIGGGPPPPPPPPPGPPPKFDIVDQQGAAPAPPASGGGLGAVFADLNKGSDVTKGLKKVSADQMTHKNPALRTTAPVPTRSDSSSSLGRERSPIPSKKPKPESMRTKKPPKKELDGNKWYIENYDNESDPIVIEASISQSIMVSRCSKTTIMVKGKGNAISVDNCARLSIVVESLVSSVDVIKASNFALQVMGTLPTILMDQVDGAQVYLSKESMKTEVFSSKCSSINLNIIEEGEEDYKEVALPEQMRSYINEAGKLVTEIVEHAG